ncbi:MAG: hypothetical protein MZW92_65495 [Comamonadaceae bacterium]|nr:hypothetical protein [Comamonadaceae bacterium]
MTRRVLHPRRPDLQRARRVADLRHPRLHRADAGGDPGAVLRRAITASMLHPTSNFTGVSP